MSRRRSEGPQKENKGGKEARERVWDEAGESEPREDEEEFVRRRHSAASAQSAADLVVLPQTGSHFLSDLSLQCWTPSSNELPQLSIMTPHKQERGQDKQEPPDVTSFVGLDQVSEADPPWRLLQTLCQSRLLAVTVFCEQQMLTWLLWSHQEAL